MFAFGVLVQRFLLKKIIAGGELNTLLYTAGLSLLIANLALFFWTGDYRNINLAYGATPMRPFGISVPCRSRSPSCWRSPSPRRSISSCRAPTPAAPSAPPRRIPIPPR